jgi:hypothetical protein
LEKYGMGNLEQLIKMVPTRTKKQIQSHAQKYFKKLAKEDAIKNKRDQKDQTKKIGNLRKKGTTFY